MADLHKLVDELSRLTVIEAAELSRRLEERWGVSATAPTVQPLQTLPVEVEAEQTEFTVILSGIDPTKKIVVIKEVRTVTGLGLKEAKEFTEQAGPTKVLKDSLPKADALALKAKMEEAGAIITIQ
jgi:large subunit ribosomal protein L7/L12